MQIELAILNRVYAPTSFRWVKVASTSQGYVTFDANNLETVAAELGRTAFPNFYVAVLYVQELRLDPPKGGISTMPNNRCGGVRLSDRPVAADGLIVLAEGRQPETLAHE